MDIYAGHTRRVCTGFEVKRRIALILNINERFDGSMGRNLK
jgi:hypothetical protein